MLTQYNLCNMEDFVTFEIAKKLKEKGFREECLLYYTKTDNLLCNSIDTFDRPNQELDYCDFQRCFNNGNPIGLVDAPTIFQVLKWLRDEKKLYVGVTYSPKIEGSQDFFYATIQYIGDYKKTIYPDDSYDRWEGAALNGIEYAIDNLI